MQETNLYTVTVPVMRKALVALDKMLDKAAAHAAKFANAYRPAAYFEEAMLNDRLIFDQFSLLMQVQRVSDNAKAGASRLAGIEPPAMPDTEKTIPELKERIAKTLAFLDTVKPEQIIGKEDSKVTLPYWKGKYLTGFDYATEYLLPNFFFHFTTAYDIMRKNGVDIGKADLMDGLPLKDL